MNEKWFLRKRRFVRIGKKIGMKEEEREEKLKERKDKEIRKSREKRREWKEDLRYFIDDVFLLRGNKEIRMFLVKCFLEIVYYIDRIRVFSNIWKNYFE